MIFCSSSVGFLWDKLRKKNEKSDFWQPIFLLFYSVVRFVFEYVRADSQMEIIGGMSKSQWFFVVFVMIAIFIRWNWEKRKNYKWVINYKRMKTRRKIRFILLFWKIVCDYFKIFGSGTEE